MIVFHCAALCRVDYGAGNRLFFSLEHFRWSPISQWRSQELQETLQSSGVNPETGLTDQEAVVHSAFQSLNKVAIVSEGKLAQQNRNTDK